MSLQINSFDRSILEFLSREAFHSPALDQFAVRLSNDLLLKGGLLMAAMWWLWFGTRGSTRAPEGQPLAGLELDDEARATRRTILLGFCGTVLALVVARTLEVLGRFRWRPLNYPD